MHGAGRPVEARVAEREDAAVGGNEPVAASVRRRRDADHRLVEVHRARRAVEPRGAVAEDAAVLGEQPVAGARRVGGDADERRVQRHRRRAERPRAAESAHGDAVGGTRGRRPEQRRTERQSEGERGDESEATAHVHLSAHCARSLSGSLRFRPQARHEAGTGRRTRRERFARLRHTPGSWGRVRTL